VRGPRAPARQRPGGAGPPQRRLRDRGRRRDAGHPPGSPAVRPPAGREDALQEIWSHLAPAQGPRLVWLHGAPGSGKSRVLRWLEVEAVVRGWHVVPMPLPSRSCVPVRREGRPWCCSTRWRPPTAPACSCWIGWRAREPPLLSRWWRRSSGRRSRVPPPRPGRGHRHRAHAPRRAPPSAHRGRGAGDGLPGHRGGGLGRARALAAPGVRWAPRTRGERSSSRGPGSEAAGSVRRRASPRSTIGRLAMISAAASALAHLRRRAAERDRGRRRGGAGRDGRWKRRARPRRRRGRRPGACARREVVPPLRRARCAPAGSDACRRERIALHRAAAGSSRRAARSPGAAPRSGRAPGTRRRAVAAWTAAAEASMRAGDPGEGAARYAEALRLVGRTDARVPACACCRRPH
jgi:hypothetical protein